MKPTIAARLLLIGIAAAPAAGILWWSHRVQKRELEKFERNQQRVNEIIAFANSVDILTRNAKEALLKNQVAVDIVFEDIVNNQDW